MQGMDMDTHMRYKDMDILDFYRSNKQDEVIIAGYHVSTQDARAMGYDVSNMLALEPDATVHEHAVSARKSAEAAAGSLKKAHKALDKTKAHVKEIVKTGKRIEVVAGKISEKYPKKQEPTPNVKSSAISASVSLSLVLASAVGVMAY